MCYHQKRRVREKEREKENMVVIKIYANKKKNVLLSCLLLKKHHTCFCLVVTNKHADT